MRAGVSRGVGGAGRPAWPALRATQSARLRTPKAIQLIPGAARRAGLLRPRSGRGEPGAPDKPRNLLCSRSCGDWGQADPLGPLAESQVVR